MRAFAAPFALIAVLVLGCGRDPNVTPVPASSPAPILRTSSASPALSAPSATSSAEVPPASGSVAPSTVAGAQCLSAAELEQDVAVSFKLGSELAVVRVAPDDVLWLRQGPGAREQPTGKLAPDARNVKATGRVCRSGDTTWYEVASGSLRGFANGSFLVPATVPKDATARFAKRLAGSPFASVAALTQAVRRALQAEQTEPSEVKFEVTLVGSARSGARAVVVLYACCYADDSVMGEQLWLEAVERDGRWSLERARGVQLCPRGATGAACI